jgi:hypothetical protein
MELDILNPTIVWIQYVPNPPAEILSRVQTRRGDRGLLLLDLDSFIPFPLLMVGTHSSGLSGRK